MNSAHKLIANGFVLITLLFAMVASPSVADSDSAIEAMQSYIPQIVNLHAG